MTAFAFGRFHYDTETVTLKQDGVPVQIGLRAQQLLHELLIHHGEVLGSDQLVAAVWPDAPVAESNLRVQMTVLRKVLGQGADGASFVTNVSGRGYCFVGAEPLAEGPAPLTVPVLQSPGSAAPAGGKILHGRSDDIERLKKEIIERRLVSVVGPGGIGKTSLATAAAAHLSASFAGGVFFIDLSTLVDGALVLPSIAAAIGSPVAEGRTEAELLMRLDHRHCLIILDNCEHVVAAAAEIADTILRHCSDVRLLATSRESLMIRTEKVVRLGPLELPVDDAIDLDQACESPAVALFIDRAGSMNQAFDAHEGNIADIVEICRRVDGIPLAIELAAARVDLFGVAGIRERLGDMFNVLTRNRRTALPRQQTLRATLDWSFSLLAAEEIRVLEIVSTLRSASPLEAIQSVGAHVLSEDEVSDIVGALVAKSLLTAERTGGRARYRLLETTRTYIQERLRDRADADILLGQHADYILTTFLKAEIDVKSTTPEVWMEMYGWLLDDVRSALHWLIAENNGAERGIRLVASSASLWFELSLLSEYQSWVESALARSRMLPGMERSIGLRLNMALGHLALQARGTLDEMAAAFSRAADAAKDGTVAEKGQAIASLWVAAITMADYAEAQACAEKFGELMADSNVTNQVICRRMLALPSHFEGRHDESSRLAREVLGQPVPSHRLPYGNGLQINPTVSMNTMLTRIAWLQGRPDEALAMAEEGLDWAVTKTSACSVCYFVAIAATPVAVWCGDDDRAHRWTNLLAQTSRDSGMLFWQKWARCLEVPMSTQGALRPFVGIADEDWNDKQLDYLATAGHFPAFAPAMLRTEQERNKWCAPEILRRWADRQEPELRYGILDRAATIARDQGAAGWLLRIASSRVEAAGDRVQSSQIDALCRAVDAIEGGATTHDVVRARRLLQHHAHMQAG